MTAIYDTDDERNYMLWMLFGSTAGSCWCNSSTPYPDITINNQKSQLKTRNDWAFKNKLPNIPLALGLSVLKVIYGIKGGLKKNTCSIINRHPQQRVHFPSLCCNCYANRTARWHRLHIQVSSMATQGGVHYRKVWLHMSKTPLE